MNLVPSISRPGTFNGWMRPYAGSWQFRGDQSACSRPRAQVCLKEVQKKVHQLRVAQREAETERGAMLPRIVNKALGGAP